MNLTHIEHLGIAVKSIEEALPYYEGVLGLKCYSVEEVADQKVKTAFFKVGFSDISSCFPDLEGETAFRQKCPKVQTALHRFNQT